MHDQSVGQVPDALLLLDGDLPVACTAVVVVDLFAGNHALQGRLEGFLILDGALESIEGLIGAANVSTIFAHGQPGHLTLKHALTDVLLRRVLEQLLESVEA